MMEGSSDCTTKTKKNVKYNAVQFINILDFMVTKRDTDLRIYDDDADEDDADDSGDTLRSTSNEHQAEDEELYSFSHLKNFVNLVGGNADNAAIQNLNFTQWNEIKGGLKQNRPMMVMDPDIVIPPIQQVMYTFVCV